MCADHDEGAAQPHSDPGGSGAVSHSDLLWRLEYEKSRLLELDRRVDRRLR